MGFVKKNFRGAVVFGCMAMLLNGYGMDAGSAALASETVMDRSGEMIAIPSAVNRILITCYGGASHEIALLGGADRIIAQPSVERFQQYTEIYKNLSKVPDAGSFNDINIEYIMMLKPDIVIASITSIQGNERIKKMGIPVVTVGTGRTTIDLLLKEFIMMGKIIDAEDDARELADYWNSKLSFIESRTGAIPESGKKTVYYCSSGTPFKTEGSVGWGQNYIDAAGGINASEELKNTGIVTAEQLLLWNPDVIISGTNRIRSPGDRIDEIRKIGAITAIKNKEIHYCPIGTFWWDRPSPEAILGILWLSKTLYPDLFNDIDIKKETIGFYKRFYHYRLTDEAYDSFFRNVKDL